MQRLAHLIILLLTLLMLTVIYGALLGLVFQYFLPYELILPSSAIGGFVISLGILAETMYNYAKGDDQ